MAYMRMQLALLSFFGSYCVVVVEWAKGVLGVSNGATSYYLWRMCDFVDPVDYAGKRI